MTFEIETNHKPFVCILGKKSIPTIPWQRFGMDLFEIAKLSSTDTKTVINDLKSIFARHGIPQVIVSDNCPQYSAAVFSKFTEDRGFTHDK